MDGPAVSTVLADAFGRVAEAVHAAVEGLGPNELAFRPDQAGNPIGWLVWHLTRVQDDHVAGAFSEEQLWLSQGWAQSFSLPYSLDETGYGQATEEVQAAKVFSAELLVGYHDAVHRRTVERVSGLAVSDLARIVDGSFDPPVDLATRLVSVIADDLQHAGQAAYVRGIVERSRRGLG